MSAKSGSASSGKVVAISGGFDPFHIGHVRLLKAARSLGDRLVVILNNDNWLKKKKGFVFMNENERKAVLKAVRFVDEVIISNHPKNPKDMSVGVELEKLKPKIFANGGDRKADNIPEYGLCEKLGIKMVFNVGGKKLQSSSELVNRALGIKSKSLK